MVQFHCSVPEFGSIQEDCADTMPARTYFEPILRMLVRDRLGWSYIKIELNSSWFQKLIQYWVGIYPRSLNSDISRFVAISLTRNWTMDDVRDHLRPLEDLLVE